MPEPLNPNFCCGCRWWNYRCTAPDDEPCGNVTPNRVFIRTAHTRRDVKKTIQETEKDIQAKRQSNGGDPSAQASQAPQRGIPAAPRPQPSRSSGQSPAVAVPVGAAKLADGKKTKK